MSEDPIGLFCSNVYLLTHTTSQRSRISAEIPGQNSAAVFPKGSGPIHPGLPRAAVKTTTEEEAEEGHLASC